jgi:hypothetical protein
MPIISRPTTPYAAVYDPPVRHIRGIPLQYFVRPIARQGGVFVDIPKGFELPGCMTDQCCPDDPETPSGG